MNHKIKVFIPDNLLQQIKNYVEACSVEISGWGLTRDIRIKPENNIGINHGILVEKLFLFKQKCSGGNTLIDAEEKNKLLEELGEDKKRLCFWWHSHVDMTAFWSGTDTTNMDEWETSPYLVSMVLNKKGDYKLRYDALLPHRHHTDDVELVIKPTKTELKVDMENSVIELFKKHGFKVNENSIRKAFKEEMSLDAKKLMRNLSFSIDIKYDNTEEYEKCKKEVEEVLIKDNPTYYPGANNKWNKEYPNYNGMDDDYGYDYMDRCNGYNTKSKEVSVLTGKEATDEWGRCQRQYEDKHNYYRKQWSDLKGD